MKSYKERTPVQVQEKDAADLKNAHEELNKLQTSIFNFKLVMTLEQKQHYKQGKIAALTIEANKLQASIDKFTNNLPADPAKQPKKTLDKIKEFQDQLDTVNAEMLAIQSSF